jgi:hypothetical protein
LELLSLEKFARLDSGPAKWLGFYEPLPFLDYEQVVHGGTLDRVSLAAGPVQFQPVDLGG